MYLESTEQLSPGMLLLANPMLADPNFKRSVILLVEHGDDGSLGFVLNRPANARLSDVMEDITAAVSPTLFIGGPVQIETLHFIHRHGDLVEDTHQIAPGIFWGGTYEQIRDLLSIGRISPLDTRFFVGYAGWAPEQLREEMTEKSWIITPSSPTIFQEDPAKLWQRTLRNMGGEFALIANFPEDPRLN